MGAVGQPISLVRDAFRFVRCGSYWVHLDRAPAIIGTTHSEVRRALEVFGFTGHWQVVSGNPTLAAFLEARQGLLRTHPCVLEVTNHWVVVSGWQFCDTWSKGMVVEADEAPRRRKRVKSVFVITGLAPPASSIPRKIYPAKQRGSGLVGKACGERRLADA